MKRTLLLFSLLLYYSTLAQNTIGLLYEDPNFQSSEGYTIFNPLSDNRVFLINKCGEVVKQWDFSHTQPSVNAYLLENGNLLQTSRFFSELRDWDNNILWNIDNQSVLGFRIHHDIEPLPNGNFLALVRDSYTSAEAIAMGKDPSFDVNLVLEKIVEIQPQGTDSASVVWEWKFYDHLVQDLDNSKPNFDVISNRPERLNINYNSRNDSNFIHANGIDYNASLDQIVFSSRHLDELFIIDHSTTTAEAATSSGGLYGKGGDFLWRWGNPQTYNKGTVSDRMIGRQHDPQWVTSGPYAGFISVFSNDGYGSDTTASSIHIVDPNETNGVYPLDSDGKFYSSTYAWSWNGDVMNEPMLTPNRGSLHIMQNGNALINESVPGRLSEVTPNGDVIWVYEIPVGTTGVYDQFDIPDGNISFKALRYPLDYPPFINNTLSLSGYLENQNVLADSCINSLSNNEILQNTTKIYPNPTTGIVKVESLNTIEKIEVFDVLGKKILTQTQTNEIDITDLRDGIYILNVHSQNSFLEKKLIKN